MFVTCGCCCNGKDLKPGLDIKDFRLPGLGQVVLKTYLHEHQLYLPTYKLVPQ